MARPPRVDALSSRLIVDATIPWDRRDSFPAAVVTAEEARERWGWILGR